MGICWNCGTEVILEGNETKCDRCGKVMQYICWNCHKTFEIKDKVMFTKLKECFWCHYFVCPNCEECSDKCPKFERGRDIRRILSSVSSLILEKEMNDLLDYIVLLKNSFIQLECPKGIPKSYIKKQIKRIHALINGGYIKNKEDSQAFKSRCDEILVFPQGTEFIISKIKQNGTYGKEYRDTFNYLTCLGELKHTSKPVKEDKKKRFYDCWIRCKEGNCHFLDLKAVVITRCPDCKKYFRENEFFCDVCKNKSGNAITLIKKISNNPSCRCLDFVVSKNKKFTI